MKGFEHQNGGINPRALLITLGLSVSALFLLCVVWVALEALSIERSMGEFTSDLAAIAQVHPLTGVVSQVGMTLWASAGAISGFAAFQHARAKSDGWIVRFLATSCLISLTLLIDDLFLVHENLGQRLPVIGEAGVLGVICVVIVGYFITYRRFILFQPALPLLLTTCVCFAIMLGVDQVQESFANQNLRYLLEDGMKFLGINGWLIWLICCCMSLDRLRPAGSPAPVPSGEQAKTTPDLSAVDSPMESKAP